VTWQVLSLRIDDNAVPTLNVLREALGSPDEKEIAKLVLRMPQVTLSLSP
jgi:hypothetical protein